MLGIDPTTGQRESIIDDLTLINDPVDAQVDINRGRELILSTFGDTDLWAFDTSSDELAKSLFGIPPQDKIAPDPLNNRLFLLSRSSSSIRAIDLETGEVSIVY